MPPVGPMLAKSVKSIPTGDYLYEPKWDGFRCVVFRDGDEVELASRGEKPLTRYFPEVVEALRANLPYRCVVDGEVVIVTDDRLDFEALLQRIHPAASRVDKLAAETPASFIAFDLLAVDDESLLDTPFTERRERLEQVMSNADAPVFLTPSTDDPAVAEQWFEVFEGAGLDGVIAKPADGHYQPDVRAMAKIKHERTADCVVAGYRWHKSGGVVGSLLLGLYDDDGHLQHVGVSASFTDEAPRRAGRRARAVRRGRRRPAIPGPPGPRPRRTRRAGCPARSAGGTPPRTCPGCRCGRTSWSR